MIRFVVVFLLSLVVFTTKSFGDLSSIDPNFFSGFYTTFVDGSQGEPPFFINKTTGQRLYIGKDIPLENLIGYRLQRYQIDSLGQHLIPVQSLTIDENTTLQHLLFEPRSIAATRVCFYALNGSLIGEKCTDRFYGHTHNPETSTPKDYYYNFDQDFYVTWVVDKADEQQLPFFHNRHTGTNWYLGRDLPLSALKGYRLQVRPINGLGDIAKGWDIKIDDQTALDDLTFKLQSRHNNAARICLYNPQGDVVGDNKSCTDSYYRHNYNPYTSEPSDYGYYGKTIVIKKISPKQDFIDDYESYSDIISNSAEVTFALRFFHNDNTPLHLNISDVYQIDLERYQATITDTETGKHFDFPFQVRNSNLTISLTASGGLEANYKRLRIAEDSDGKLYSSNILSLSDVTSSDDVIDRIVNEPFYQLENPNNAPVYFTLLNANVYVSDTYEHHITKRCTEFYPPVAGPAAIPIAEVFLGLLSTFEGASTGVCGPTLLKRVNDNYKSPLETDITHAAPLPHDAQDTVGYTLVKSLALTGEDSAAFLTAIRYCHMDADKALAAVRERRAPGRCFDWVRRLTALWTILRLNLQGVFYTVIDSIINRGVVPRDAYPEGEAPSTRQQREEEQSLIATVRDVGREPAIGALTQYGAVSGQAAAANVAEFHMTASGEVRSEPEVRQAVADGVVGLYRLSSPDDFSPLPNVVRQINDNGVIIDHGDQRYRTRIEVVTEANLSGMSAVLEELGTILDNWHSSLSGDTSEGIVSDARLIVTFMVGVVRLAQLERLESGSSEMLFGLVYSPDDELLGLSFGSVVGTTYRANFGVARPQDLGNGPGVYRSAVAYLRSEMLRRAFADGATNAEAHAISPHSAKSIFKLGFRRDEL